MSDDLDVFANLPAQDPLLLFARIADKLHTSWLRFSYPFLEFGTGAWVSRRSKISRSAARLIAVGENVAIQRDVELDVGHSTNVNSPVLRLKNGCFLQRRAKIIARHSVHLESFVSCAHGVLIMDHEQSSTGSKSSRSGEVLIEEGCWIGFGAKVICAEGQLVIGKHSVVAANSVVRHSVPPYCVVAGAPAGIVRQFDLTKRKWMTGYVRVGPGYRSPDASPKLT